MKNFKTISQYVAATAVTVGSLLPATPVMATNALGSNLDQPDGFAPDMGTLINATLTFVMVIAALLVLFYLIWGGIEWITSGGDKSKTESARNKITAAVIGIVILAAAFAIFQLVITFLGFSNLNDVFNVQTLS